MRLLFVGGTGPVGVAACRAATERGHHVIVAHTGAHELPNDIDAEHFHGAREERLAPNGPIVVRAGSTRTWIRQRVRPG